MTLRRSAPAKINLVLNILGRREDGFHELETLILPVPLHDELTFEPGGDTVTLTCSHPDVPTGPANLILRAAGAFSAATGTRWGGRIHLEKRIPMEAGLGGGSSNAAVTLQTLNELAGHPLSAEKLVRLAAELGSDVPCFLAGGPVLGRGRGEQLEPVAPLTALRGLALLLIHPGFGVSTPWAYRRLADFPEALHGTPGRAAQVAADLAAGRREAGLAGCVNSLEAPVWHKFPVLELYARFLVEHGALRARMSGSGSTTFALFADAATAETARERFLAHFGATCWTALLPLDA
jgi:4-diphosphocytidyl-2-C-methyl-D-erythritol kinase